MQKLDTLIIQIRRGALIGFPIPMDVDLVGNLAMVLCGCLPDKAELLMPALTGINKILVGKITITNILLNKEN